jgi:hypothetical protein
MLRRAEKEWDLTIGPDTVRLLAQKANAVSAAVNEDYEDGAEHEVEYDGDRRDNHHHDGLQEEEAQNLTAVELKALIDDLNVDEASELIALAWIGRGDFDAGEWKEAVAEARQRPKNKTSLYLMNMPMLGDWLEDGLEAIGA